MLHPWNAQHAEIEAWARQADADEPTEDWDLAVTEEVNAALIFRLASDDTCPNHWFFLRCLYLFVGDAVRTDFQGHSRACIDGLLAAVSEGAPPRIVRWAERARALIQSGTTKVDYDDWCCGRLASIERLAAG